MEPWADDATHIAGQTLKYERDAALAEVDRLRRLVTTLVKIPAQHRDDYLSRHDPEAPDMIARMKTGAVRDTCDVLRKQLQAAATEAVARPCPTCGSPLRKVRLIPSPTDADYRNGTFNDPDYDPKFSNPCTDPWHDETPRSNP